MSEFLPFHRPTIYDSHVEAVTSALRSGWLTSAGKVEQFEEAFSEKVGSKYAVAVNSCTAALHLTLIGLGIGPGDEVITSPITFVSAVNVIEHVGARPVFADVRTEDLTLDPDSVKRKITGATKLIIATHFAGFPVCMDRLESFGIPIVTDAAHAIETVYHERKSGQLGIAACYSFYATKNITTGEGGMIATNNPEIADRARILRLHGMTKDAWGRYGKDGYKHWDVAEPGWKYNMGDIQAALGLSQLKDLEAWLGKRVMLSMAYKNYLPANIKLMTPVDEDVRLAHHLFVVRINDRDRVMNEMQQRGIGVGVHFRAVHRLEYYRKKYAIQDGELPVAEKASDEVLSLPLYPSLQSLDVIRVAGILGQVI